MKTKLIAWCKTGWRVLTEVPGWPDAPVWMRMQRAMPVLIPCTAMVLMLDWNLLVQAPKISDQRSALAPLIALETEVTGLRLSSSVHLAHEMEERAATASRLMLSSPSEAPSLLQEMKKDAAVRGWDAAFIASDPAAHPPLPGAVINYLPVRAKLVPLAKNQDVFGSFVGLLESISQSPKRIDLIRLAIRADEHRWQLVELNLRVVYPTYREKTP